MNYTCCQAILVWKVFANTGSVNFYEKGLLAAMIMVSRAYGICKDSVKGNEWIYKGVRQEYIFKSAVAVSLIG
jgi:hypothetical protein